MTVVNDRGGPVDYSASPVPYWGTFVPEKLEYGPAISEPCPLKRICGRALSGRYNAPWMIHVIFTVKHSSFEMTDAI